jgi:amidase
MDELIRLGAREAVARLARGEVTPLELIDAAEARIAETEGVLNALPTLCFERARERARRLAGDPPAEPPPHFLHGLPIAVKDLDEVEGVRTTFGSPIFADHVSTFSDYMVERLEANGAIVIAKSNTPELGAGSQTFNEVFGRTANPWDARLTPGGSSGGSAAALAAGQVWLATGSDLGGSLRNPASFCSVVGLRPSPGRIAHGPAALPFADMAVHGPMARNVADVALMLDAMVGRHSDDPLSLEPPVTPYLSAIAAPAAPQRVAFSPDLGGIVPVEPEVAAICARAAQAFTGLGAAVEEACPDLSGAKDIFHVLRAAAFATARGALLDKHRDALKPEVIWNIEAGRALAIDELVRAELARGALHHRAVAFFDDTDLLLCPAAIVAPFDGSIRWPGEVAGTRFETYVDWMLVCSAITLTACPALSVPCGFTADGRPVGLQMVAPPRREDRLIAAAHLFEQAHDFAAMVPIDPRPAA